ncbi:MAG: DUF1461 domain-containing protein [Candidatus Woesearchaeota archaeon]
MAENNTKTTLKSPLTILSTLFIILFLPLALILLGLLFTEHYTYILFFMFLYTLELEALELSHMIDVRRLLVVAHILLATAIIYLIRTKTWSHTTQKVTSSVFILLGLWGVISFNSFWHAFHYVFFPQGNWMFPPESALIQQFPETFFVRTLATYVLLYATIAILSNRFINNKKTKTL